MIRVILALCMVCLPLTTFAGDEGKPTVCLLDGHHVQPMRDGLKRVQCTFSDIAKLDTQTLAKCRVLILCGTNPPVDAAGKEAIASFLDRGGAVLGVGGGATCMIKHKLFDAEGYCLTGTTVHMTKFFGYHRLTFGYPGAKPVDGWKYGVPQLLRATQGPLMELGPKPTSILGYDGGGLYSAAAFQRVGKGLVLLIGPDPQGGDAYYSLEKPKMEPGDKLKTDRLLANAIAFLVDPCCNIIPNNGCEENTNLPAHQSNWQIVVRDGATSDWCRDGAPEGNVFLKVAGPQENSNATIQPYCPLIVERGANYRFACLYRSSLKWQVQFDLLVGSTPALKRGSGPSVSVQASQKWRRFETTVAIPPDVSYVRPMVTARGVGSFCLDEVTLQREL